MDARLLQEGIAYEHAPISGTLRRRRHRALDRRGLARKDPRRVAAQ